jgi:choline dehydrogenase
MCYTRGHRKDYDQWAELGNSNWDYAGVLPYFKRAEHHERGGTEFHGEGGPLNIADLRYTNQLSEVFLQAASECDFILNNDFSGPSQRGFGFYQVNQKDGKRCSTADGYLNPAKSRPNLTILTHAQTRKVLVENDTAVGVEYQRNGKLHQAHAQAEVLLAAGAVNSPQLLMLSGIGPVDVLEKSAIQVVHPLAGVGRNLQDHLDVCTLYHCTQDITYDHPNELVAGLQYLLFHRGMGTSNAAEAGGFHVSRLATDDRPDLQFHFVPAMLDDHGRNHLDGNGFTMHCCVLRPESRGHLELNPDDPHGHPLIHANYLEGEKDLELMVEGVKVSRQIFNSRAFDPYRGDEIFPGAEVQNDAEIIEFIRNKAETIYHPVGTCKMGVDELAVVDPQLRLHGIDQLRVIDASVMPKLVSGNTNAPTVMIAEKACDLIRSVEPATAGEA